MGKKILVLSNHPTWTYKLRGEVLKALVDDGYKVIVAVGYGPEIEKMKGWGCEHINLSFSRRSINPIKELRLFWDYCNLINKVKPDVIITYTIKPNLYGAFLGNILQIPCLINITGLGSALEKPGFLQTFFLSLYRFIFKKTYRVFLQNKANRDLFISKGIVKDNFVLLPGSGVNLERYHPLSYPSDKTIEFVFIARILKAKGIEEYLKAAKCIREKFPQTRFHICGFCDQDYSKVLSHYEREGIVITHGMVEDTRDIYKVTHCTVLPSWYSEGINNVLLESAACARPIITTNRPGCGEVVDDGVNGYIVKQQDAEDLISKLKLFILLSYEKKIAMGLAGRKKVEAQFDREIVVDEYLKAVNSAVK